jgi:hypothetical protein
MSKTYLTIRTIVRAVFYTASMLAILAIGRLVIIALWAING